MHEELLTAVLLAACALCFGAGALWQIRRRQTPARRPRMRRVERMPGRAEDVKKPAEAPKPTRPELHGPARPGMLAIAEVPGDATHADVYIQRALEADLPHYAEVEAEPHDLKTLSHLFERCPILEREPGDGFAEDVYAVSFTPAIESAHLQGFSPRINATASDLHIIALDSHGAQLGLPMPTADYGWGTPSHINTLWNLMNPAEQKHFLDGELRSELEFIEKELPKLKLLIPAVRGLEWQKHFDELFELSRDVRRLGLEEGRVQERILRADDLAAAMRDVNRRIDTAIKTFAGSIKDAEEADLALTSCVGSLHEREMAVLFLRAIAVIRVIASDDYMHGMRCSARLELNVKEFPDVHLLLDRARRIAEEALVNRSRAMNDAEMALVENVRKDADRLAKEHDELHARLERDVARLQGLIDRHLILQGRRRRFAVRLKSDLSIGALLVLQQ